MSGIQLSPKHGLNPAIPRCFFCNEPKNEILLFGRLKGDVEAPHGMVLNHEPCEQCKKYMEMGVILISIRDNARPCECLTCKHTWREPLTMSEHTANLSGEATIFCPQCSSKSVSAGPVEKEDYRNPYRTGGWVVVREDFIRRAIDAGEALDRVLRQRFAFMPDRVWDSFGLPRTADDVEKMPTGAPK